MCRTRVVCRDALSLCHRECGVEERTVVIVLCIEIAQLAVELLAYVVRRIHLLAVLERSDGEVGDVLHREVEVLPVLSVVDVTVILHLVCLVIRTARVVHHHDECAFEWTANGVVVELLRCELARFADRLAFLVAELVCKFLHRLTHCHGEHAINGAEHLCLAVLDGLLLLSVSHHLAELQTILAELGRDERRNLGCVLS